MKTLKLCLATLLFAAGSAWADDLVINLDAATLTGSSGDLLSFSGTITSNDLAPIDLNDISVSLAGNVHRRPDAVSVGAIYGRRPWNTVDFTLFTVTIDAPYTDPFGPVEGTVTILDGVESGNVYDASAVNYLGQTGFTVDPVGPEISTVPEVSTVWMLLPVVVCLWWIGRRRRTVGCGPAGATRV
jgi:hypothetical protein